MSALSKKTLFRVSWTPAFATLHQTLFSSHRFPDLHDCPSFIEKVPNAKPIKSASSSAQRLATISTRKPPSDPTKLAQWRKVELMKMRHRANPADSKDQVSSVPIDQRIHVRILEDNKEKIFWLKKVSVRLVGYMYLCKCSDSPRVSPLGKPSAFLSTI